MIPFFKVWSIVKTNINKVLSTVAHNSRSETVALTVICSGDEFSAKKASEQLWNSPCTLIPAGRFSCDQGYTLFISPAQTLGSPSYLPLASFCLRLSLLVFQWIRSQETSAAKSCRESTPPPHPTITIITLSQKELYLCHSNEIVCHGIALKLKGFWWGMGQ